MFVRFIVCSETKHKPLTRAVCEQRAEAERLLETFKRDDPQSQETHYWIAEVGAESEAWRCVASAQSKTL
ncbi:MAG: hypothetical protein R3C68_15770 [Myxococcota bacterium]